MLQDFNANDNHLSVERGGAGWSGVGRLPSVQPQILVADNEAAEQQAYAGGEYVSYEEVSPPRTNQTVQLPQFDFTTGVSSCACPSDTSGKVAAANAVAVVTPMADAPKSINWLLILGAAGIGYYFLKGNPKPGMGTLDPEPIVQDLGRPASKPKAKPKRVAHLSI